eukprot:CAMPEP_0119150564 /NCGR_PEP_ID=MMETSP1310-20130426/45007_1 /TAXON_ID=464262 /ORGANISM="Genus nov. species nov., Strain RCC2339" /LENGTH=252 /DNA_ID=CAMNT_0007142767 /DNA_START=24 /DNA_END=779 /DNA_ORIENTATION=+
MGKEGGRNLGEVELEVVGDVEAKGENVEVTMVDEDSDDNCYDESSEEEEVEAEEGEVEKGPQLSDLSEVKKTKSDQTVEQESKEVRRVALDVTPPQSEEKQRGLFLTRQDRERVTLQEKSHLPTFSTNARRSQTTSNIGAVKKAERRTENSTWKVGTAATSQVPNKKQARRSVSHRDMVDTFLCEGAEAVSLETEKAERTKLGGSRVMDAGDHECEKNKNKGGEEDGTSVSKSPRPVVLISEREDSAVRFTG